MIRHVTVCLGMLAMVGGCEVFNRFGPGIVNGIGTTIGASIASFALGALGIPVAF